MSQYTLSLKLPPVFSTDNFFVSDCNRDAHRWISAWPDWPAHVLVLHGLEGSGKSHLGHIWATASGASILAAAALEDHPPVTQGNWLIEDIETLKSERGMLHLFNASRENDGWLLLTAAEPPERLPFTLPDLSSRLLAIPSVAIGQPDDDVLIFVMRKQFTDRQMVVGDEVLAYLASRMERSLTSAKAMVERLDAATLAERKNLTIPFIKRLLDQDIPQLFD